MNDLLDEHQEVLEDLLGDIDDIKTRRSISLALVSLYTKLGRSELIKETLSKLLESDPIRSGYYRHLLDRI